MIAADCGVMWIGVTLRYVPMTSKVAVACWDRGVFVAVAFVIAVVIAVVVATGSGCDYGKDCGCEVVWGEGGRRVGYL